MRLRLTSEAFDNSARKTVDCFQSFSNTIATSELRTCLPAKHFGLGLSGVSRENIDQLGKYNLVSIYTLQLYHGGL